jgi:hypothetical protein
MHRKNYSDGTSEDTEGKDSSFDSINDELESEQKKKKEVNENKSAKLLEYLQFKQQKYQELMRKVKQKGEENGKKSPWCTLYYTFFNNFYKKNFVTLNEINLRCRFLWKIDQLEKEARRSKSEPKDYINKPLTNLNEFINYFSDKKFNTNSPKKQKDNIKSEKNLKKEKYPENNFTNNNINMNIKNIQKKEVKDNNFGKNKESLNLFHLYGIKKPLDFINKIIKDERKNSYGINKTKNFEILLSNKKIYEQEIDNYFKTAKDSSINMKIYEEFLDFKSNENFFNDNAGVDLISKYGNKLEEQEKFGNHLNQFYSKVINNIDPMQKLDEFNM